MLYSTIRILFSLLDILAGHKDKHGLSGTVLVNGKQQPKNFKCISGYVVQVSMQCNICTHYFVQ